MNNNQSFDQILNTEAFKNIHPKKRQILKEMFVLMQDKVTEQKLQILFAYGMRMKNLGLQLTTSESSALMSVLKENLSPNERQKIDMMMKMMK